MLVLVVMVDETEVESSIEFHQEFVYSNSFYNFYCQVSQSNCKILYAGILEVFVEEVGSLYSGT